MVLSFSATRAMQKITRGEREIADYRDRAALSKDAPMQPYRDKCNKSFSKDRTFASSEGGGSVFPFGMLSMDALMAGDRGLEVERYLSHDKR